MQILTILRSIFWPGDTIEGRSTLSRRFIIAISILFSLFILALSISFQVAMNKNAAILRSALAAQNSAVFTGTIGPIFEQIQSDRIKSVRDVTDVLRARRHVAGDLLMVNIFMRSTDENFFRVADTVSFRDDLSPEIEKSALVKEGKAINYLKMGLLNPAVDPDIYSRNGYFWQNVYFPLEIAKRRSVVQCRVSVSETWHAIGAYLEETRGIRIFMAVLAILVIGSVIALSVVLAHNYSLLINNLSAYMKKAAEGDLDIALHESGDADLDRLALSFNALVEEMKDRPARSMPPEADTGAFFTTGVALLKENRLDEAIALFHAITRIKPLGFGSYFNLGVAYAKKGEYDRAEEMFKEALAVNPSYRLSAEYIEKIVKLRERHG